MKIPTTNHFSTFLKWGKIHTVCPILLVRKWGTGRAVAMSELIQPLSEKGVLVAVFVVDAYPETNYYDTVVRPEWTRIARLPSWGWQWRWSTTTKAYVESLGIPKRNFLAETVPPDDPEPGIASFVESITNKARDTLDNYDCDPPYVQEFFTTLRKISSGDLYGMQIRPVE